jgi:hypothetical protein
MIELPLKPAIIKEIRAWYETAPEEFHMQSLTVHVGYMIRIKYNREPFDDTIARYFRQLKGTDELKCECKNKQKSLYVKL